MIIHRYNRVVGASEFESPTPTMSRWCSNQLSYAPIGPTEFQCLHSEISVFHEIRDVPETKRMIPRLMGFGKSFLT